MRDRELPAEVVKYTETRVFTERDIPEKLLNLHDTKPGVWGRIVVIEGALDYFIPGPPEQLFHLDRNKAGVIRPAELHRVAPDGAVRFKVEFFR